MAESFSPSSSSSFFLLVALVVAAAQSYITSIVVAILGAVPVLEPSNSTLASSRFQQTPPASNRRQLQDPRSASNAPITMPSMLRWWRRRGAHQYIIVATTFDPFLYQVYSTGQYTDTQYPARGERHTMDKRTDCSIEKVVASCSISKDFNIYCEKLE